METDRNAKTAPSPAGRIRAWDEFGERLEKVLGMLQEDHGLIVQEKSTNRYVQFLGQGAGGMRVEAVSNAYLSGRERLTPAQVQALIALGWQAPTGSPEEATPQQQPEGSPNFMRQFHSPVDAKTAAALGVATLADVMGVPHPGLLCYEGRNVDTGDSLSWSELGLKFAEPRGTLAQAADQQLRTLREETGNEALDFDDDGDVALRSGSVLVFVRVAGDLPAVRIYAPVLLEVRKTSALLERLNDLNARVVRPVFVFDSDRVIAVSELSAAPYMAQHVVPALREFCTLTDGVDELLQRQFGGRTAFSSDMISTEIH